MRRMCSVCSAAASGAARVGSIRALDPASVSARRSFASTSHLQQSPSLFNGDRGRQRSGSAPSASKKSYRYRRGYIPLSFLALPPILYWAWSSVAGDDPLSPYSYTDHTVSTKRKLTSKHIEIAVPLDAASRDLFHHPELVAAGPSRPTASRAAGTGTGEGNGSRAITVHHLMVKNPDLMIERPYTPVNDVEADGQARLVVKRVRGGEVGRMIHALQDGSKLGLRGPLPTLTLDPTDYDRIVMISSGTGAAPFLQLLAKLPASSANAVSPQLHLIHALPPQGTSESGHEQDWIQDTSLLPALQAKHRSNLRVDRTVHGVTQRDVVTSAVKRSPGERIMVLACLPPNLMRDLCGNLTATLEQGELTGLLRDLGLNKSEVWKLE